MAELIYRGTRHNGIREALVKTECVLVYRGLRHNGLRVEAPAPKRKVLMCYRAVSYLENDLLEAIPA